MNMHVPVPSLEPRLCVRCGGMVDNPVLHPLPVVTVSPKREPAVVARRTDPETSWEAARSVTGIRESQAEVLALFRKFGPMTDEEVAWHVIGRTPSGLRTRRSELVKAGLLHWTGETRVGSTGRKMRVWSA